jgi:hypothetical protein
MLTAYKLKHVMENPHILLIMGKFCPSMYQFARLIFETTQVFPWNSELKVNNGSFRTYWGPILCTLPTLSTEVLTNSSSHKNILTDPKSAINL